MSTTIARLSSVFVACRSVDSTTRKINVHNPTPYSTAHPDLDSPHDSNKYVHAHELTTIVVTNVYNSVVDDNIFFLIITQ